MVYTRLKELREEAGWSQAQVASRLFCSQQAYSNYELGQRDLPTQTLIELAALYGTTTDYILGVDDCRKRQNEKQTAFLD